MSHRIRGKEVTLRISVDGQVKRTLVKVTDFTVRQRGELVEQDFIGEAETDLDFLHSGWDLSGTMHMLDHEIIDLVQLLAERDRAGEPHPDITLTVLYSFREPGAQNRAVVYYGAKFMFPEEGFSGRKEYVSAAFEAKAKRRAVLAA